MKASEIRSRYLEFFRKRGHTVEKSDSLVPENDPSVLFTGAGMNQFKDMFLGKGNKPYVRAATSQKCMRTGDLENVGRTPSHHTFFEMLGNFSFGDYFKAEMIPWAWEFCTQDLRIDPARLNVTVYQDDSEALEIWAKIIPRERIFKGDAKDNFWPANAPTDGPNGPCGPCSEIYFDRGEQYGCGKPDCTPLCNRCKRHIEIWNLVFTQFDRQADGSLPPLPRKNIDTGMGLERVAATLQGVPTNFDTDLFRPLIRRIEEITGKVYAPEGADTPRFRRIADHARAVTFLIGDGVQPGNTEREYVVRRLLRRACDDGRSLGMRDAWVYRLVPAVCEAMGEAYPGIVERRENIARIVKAEEEHYDRTLEAAAEVMEREFARVKGARGAEFSAQVAFDLHATHGYPFEQLEVLAKERGVGIDRAGYAALMDEHVKKSGRATSEQVFALGPLAKIKPHVKPTQFLGYSELSGTAVVKGIIVGSDTVDGAGAETSVRVILDRTPFYAESGGQVGDSGFLRGDGVEVRVEETKKVEGYFLHHGKVQKGTLKPGMSLQAAVDVERRRAIERNHTGTHILNNALRAVLGKHVEQAGSLVAPDRLRFDFNHFQALTRDELRRIENTVNERIMENAAVSTAEMPMAQAKSLGALMFFQDKYGDVVRVVSVGDWSRELCGGTHVPAAGAIGYFHITGEGSVAGGVRRIEAVTGLGAVQAVMALEDRVQAASMMLNTPSSKLPSRIQELLDELQVLKREQERARRAAAADEAGGLVGKAFPAGGEKAVVEQLQGRSADDLRGMIDTLVKDSKLAAAALGSVFEDKPVLVIGVRADLVGKLDAGAIAKEAGKAMGAGGGGKKDFAQCGGKDPARVPAGLDAARAAIRKALG
ncbi:MAG: alanine--tRNA ligase [Candidatus Brocadiae bacterium]|nr:alanine--tRNA ligase [Candidatus Brocadiia bacterium]